MAGVSNKDNMDTSSNMMADRGWIDVQKKTFTNWTNDKLKATEIQVEDLQVDLKDGVALITLLQLLAPGKKMPGRYKAKPRMDIHKRENLTIVFRFMIDVERIPLVNIGAMDIYQCNLKLILGLIWTLILRYQIAGPVTHDTPDHSKTKKEKKEVKEKTSAKKLLINWVNIVIPKRNVSNFSSSWNDGLALSALVDYCKPGLIPDHASLDPNNKLENIKRAMDIAEKELGVPQVMHPEDMAVEKPDELSVMTYVSGYSHQDSAGQKSLLEWVNTKIPHQPVSNLSSDWINGLALSALTDVLSGGQFPEYEKMFPENALDNCQQAMQKAQLLLEVELLATPEEFSKLSLNQLTRVSYIAQFQSCKSKDLIDSIKVEGKGITGDIIEKETSFVVTAPRIPKWAKLRATVTTPDSIHLDVQELPQSANAIQFTYTPPTAGEYVVDIYMNNVSLPPYCVKHILPTLASKCRASGSGLKTACVEKKAEFTVDCEQGGRGELRVKVQGPQSTLHPTMDETKPQNYNVTFVPEEVGDHEITISWGDEQIPESPFQCAVIDPKMCTTSGEGLTQAIVNNPQTFVVHSQTAGPGELSVKVQGPNGTVPVEINDLQNKTFSCTYVPEETGAHVIDIYWSDIPIDESPFKVNVIAPTHTSKCRASGSGLKTACVDKKAEFTVDCEQGGRGELRVKVQGPQSTLHPTMDETKPQNYNVTFVPEEVGDHEITISWGDEQIPESPFQCAVIDPKMCTTSGEGLTQAIIVNNPQTFVVHSQTAGPGELLVKVQGPNGTVPVEINDLQNKSFSCTYVPEETGAHVIDIYWSDIPIDKSPFKVNAIAPTHTSKCRASGSGLKTACVDKKAEFTVDCEQGGRGELRVKVQGPQSTLHPTMDETKPQNYNVTFVPEEVGDHEITISWGDEQIPESPFQCAVIDPKMCTTSGEGLTQAIVNNPQTFVVHSQTAGPGELTVKVQGPNGTVPVEINDLQNKSFSCTYVPEETGAHVIDIYWSDIPIDKSPFKVNAIAPTHTSKCRASGSGLKTACVDKKAEFTVDCEQGGRGELQVKVQGPQSTLHPTMDETKPQNYNVTFVPEEVGDHEITISWGDEQIPESPFQCAVIDPKMCTTSGEGLTQAIIVNNPQTFVVHSQTAGPGELSVKVQGPNGTVPVEIKDLQNKSFSCTYVPEETGAHVIDIYWSDIPIDESPFKVNAIAPTHTSKCRASGSGLKTACVDKKAEFTVDCEQGGRGELQVKVQGPQSTLHPTMDETKPQNYNVTFVPEEVGDHEITISWGDEQIPESPFQCAVIDPKMCTTSGEGLTQAIVNNPQTFVVHSQTAGPGELSVKVQGPNGTVQVEINDLQNKSFSCTYVPEETGAHVIDIYWSDIPIAESPFKVNAIALADPLKCTISDLPDGELCVNKTYSFKVNTTQPNSQCEITVTTQDKSNLDNCTVVTSPERGVYDVQFVPTETGRVTMEVKCNDVAIPTSPLVFSVCDPKPIKEECDFQLMDSIEESIYIPEEDLEDLEATPNTDTTDKSDNKTDDLLITIGEPLTLVIDLEAADMNKEITANVSGRDCEPVSIPVTKNSDDTITVCFDPTTPDSYTIDIKVDGEQIPSGPFFVTYIEPIQISQPVSNETQEQSTKITSESQTMIFKPKEDEEEKISVTYNCRRSVNTCMTFAVKSETAETSDTSVSVQEASPSSESPQVPNKFSELSSGQYKLEFTSTGVQEYTVVLRYLLRITPEAQQELLAGQPFVLSL